ncbi:MAG: homoserine O-succinyltransferase [Bradyrhizobium sp.]|uniref:homoserine O-succinyltransferase MetA n=1 Tax=Bradyrhizobium sp. TaxID=376 RepID=UPI0025B89D7C|nr:homoserine O-succinyltransferase [Bradyrhizobium sp.]MBI5260814.1 homoserine O-succinyltransferase [Bradyrhizobium sp.]
MPVLIDKDQGISSPALAPGEDEFAQSQRSSIELTIGLINNMPDPALKATERQFMRLLQAASGGKRVRFHCFSLPSVVRSPEAQWHVETEYSDISDLTSSRLDGLIVTGAEPLAPHLPLEPFWRDLVDIVDWAKDNTRSTIWSCLAAHAAVLHLDGIERRRLQSKCSGIYGCERVSHDPLISYAPGTLKVPHSRLNEVTESDLLARGYQVVTRSKDAGVDIFVRQFSSRFVFFQGHPEYDALSLQREYLRDVGRFLSRERDAYPAVPASYFDAATEDRLARFEKRARHQRHPALAADLPALTLRSDIAAGTAAAVLFRNWLDDLAEGAVAALPAR